MKKFFALFLTLTIAVSLSSHAFAADSNEIDDILKNVGNYLYETVSDPQVNPVGGEWTVIGLARCDMDIPDLYFENYYQTVIKYVKACEGILHNKKYTEYSRVILALTSIGKNPRDVAGYNLLTPLGDFEKTKWQGINSAIWALIALDSGNYDIPVNSNAKVQATREMYINHILENQTSDGGWTLSGDAADPDITGMALQALSRYQDNDMVKYATEKALNCLSEMQKENGGFEDYETADSEGTVQVLVALCELGISTQDTRFIKNGKSVVDNLFTFCENKKSFKHTQKGTSNLMATEQGFYALVALKRARENKNSLYDMRDVKNLNVVSDISGLAGKNQDVKKMDIINPGKTFTDIENHNDKKAIEALASRKIINGKTENLFEPNSLMSRAEFATIIARGLGLLQKNSSVFKDVNKNDWFYNYVNTAYYYGIIKGISENEFNPNGTINREEAAVMIARAAALCGADIEIEVFERRNILAGFIDYVKVSSWATESLSYCYKEGILPDEDMNIEPKKAITRAEVAHMLYNMLKCVNLMEE